MLCLFRIPSFFAVLGGRIHAILCLISSAALLAHSLATPLPVDQREFFESRIRPILAQDCYECHSSQGTRKGGLALDHREALLAGGDSGPVIVAGDPAASLLMQAIQHRSEDLQMPKAGAKLEEDVLADFDRWIAMGAPDPRDTPPSEDVLAEDTDWQAVMDRRKRWWSFQPIRDPSLEALPGTAADHPVDRFIARRLQEAGLNQADPADPLTLVRRLSFVLRGLPPSTKDLESFARDPSDEAYRSLVDRYLDSPQFGERWARRWMDWVRYAESHGSEGDPAIPYAWRYRDYLIRALNNDVPYDQLAREHLAGDLMDSPRLNAPLGLNESAIGPAHLRMVFHGFAPTDALDEQVRFTDDQINVVSKAFLGLTVSCARCHDHKFDPISQRDFYSWYGIFASCVPASIAINAPSEEVSATRRELREMKQEIKAALIAAWTAQLPEIEEKLHANASFEKSLEEAKQPGDLFHALRLAREGRDLSALVDSLEPSAPQKSSSSVDALRDWDLADPETSKTWFRDGEGVQVPGSSGEFAIALEGEAILTGIYPAGLYSHGLTDRDRGVLLSPRFQLETPSDLWLQVAGEGGSVMRYVVQNYPRSGTVYPVGNLNGGEWRWQRYPLDYWTGDHLHVELSTAADQAVLANPNRHRSWFGIRRVLLLPQGKQPPRDPHGVSQPVVQKLAAGLSVPRAYAKAIITSLKQWKQNRLSDSQAAFLGEAIRVGLLPNDVSELSTLEPHLKAYREREARLPETVRAPGVLEKDAFDQPLFDRGNHKRPLEPVARRFLDAIDATPYATSDSGRLALADDLFHEDNPLTVRVIVNRLWHHTFGEGLVRTPDNFGRLGQKPSHPALLDHLAHRFRSQGYSIKSLLRYLVHSETWKAASTPPEDATAQDPENRLLSHAHLRRLEAEALRDTLLAVAGRLDTTMHGPPAGLESNRRSVYLPVRRNNLSPFLSTFDAPVPASTKGRRDVTNVPGQSLTLLNDPFVLQIARELGARLERRNHANGKPIHHLFVTVLGREPTLEEGTNANAYLRDSLRRQSEIRERLALAKSKRDDSKSKLNALRKRIEQRILTQRAASPGSSPDAQNEPSPGLPAAVARWSFENGLNDDSGTLKGEAHGNARVIEGQLVLDGSHGTYVSTEPLKNRLHTKTLEAWVQLDDLDQQGGGVVSVQDLRGDVFDAIVIGEQARRHWMAGSNHFARTAPLEGPEESQAREEPIHIAITYEIDGTITAYREGIPYGKPYPSDGPVVFESGKCQILFGNRHGEPARGHLLRGRIEAAALYDRALTPEEIADSASGDPRRVSQKDMEAAMTEEERKLFQKHRSIVDALEASLTDLKSESGGLFGWATLAHAVLNLKEFLFIR